MAYWYGKNFSGTKTTAKRFKNALAGKNKTNLHHVTVGNNDVVTDIVNGNRYRAAAAGICSEVKWSFIDTPVSKAPQAANTPNVGAPTRTDGTRKMKSTWKVPSNFAAATNPARAGSIEVEWTLDVTGDNWHVLVPYGSATKADATLDLSDFAAGGRRYNRTSFYPVNPSRRLYGVSLRLRGVNSVGKGSWGKPAKREFVVPKKPSIAAWAFNEDNGTASTTITIPESTSGHAERYDSVYTWTIRKRVGRSETTVKNETGNFTAASKSFSWDFDDYQGLDDGDYYVMELSCKSRGFAGDGQSASRRFVISPPARAAVGKIEVTSKTSTGLVRVPVKLAHKYKTHTETVVRNGKKQSVTVNDFVTDEITGIRLQVLENVPYSKPSQIPGDLDWRDVGSPDDDGCEVLSTGVSQLLCDPGNHSWVRIKTWRFDADNAAMTRYSAYVEVPGLYVPAPSAVDDECSILSATPGDDGRSAVLVIGWDKVGAGTRDDATGTELTWSDDEDCWTSTVEPESHEFEWSDAASADPAWYKTATITVKKLAGGTTYYFRARRYHEGDTVTYGAYSAMKSTTPTVAPDDVRLSAPDYVAQGKPVPLSWTYGGGGVQTAWEVVSGDVTLAEGADALGSTSIPWERIAPRVANGAVSLAVRVSTGGDPEQSEPVDVRIAVAPTLAIGAATLTAQPFAFTATCSTTAKLTAAVRSLGVPYSAPDGNGVQPAGDVVWSGVVEPAWTAANGGYTATCAIDAGRPFIDGGRYVLAVTATADVSGLESPEVTAEFGVEWAAPATPLLVDGAPDPCIGVLSWDEDDADGLGLPEASCQLTLTPPAGAGASDVYDVYRMSPDGPQAVGIGLPLTYTVVDRYAPFGDGVALSYRVALRTPDGSVEWADYGYNMAGAAMRFDWDGKSVELPYNIGLSDAYAKGGEVREHMDGSATGHWNGNVSRRASLTTDIIRIDSQQDTALVRDMARYPGAVFVRLPDGCAFEADVQVDGLDTDGPVVAASIQASEVALTQEFGLPLPEDEEEEEEGE